ncbi:MAG: heterodisulfide reductase-related iron-sulfur binding cluster [Alphaproteobacteria bacterium]
MRTQFSPAQLNDTQMAQSEKILRACVHCGFCNATCPTYLQTGDENDGPRGRIYLMREMLQSSAAPDARTVAHIDSCLSCLGCATTCPSGVDYMRLVDHARAHIETHYRRPLFERLLRAALGFVLPHPARFAFALRLGRLAAPFSKFMPARLARMTAMASFGDQKIMMSLRGAQRRGNPEPHSEAFERGSGSPRFAHDDKENVGILGETKKLRVVLLNGCVQPVLAPGINAAAIRLLTRLGVEVIVPEAAGCCGALSHHLGRTEAARQFARANIRAWMACAADGGLDAIVMTASGCGTQVKDYGHLLREDIPFADDAARISAITLDISEFLFDLEMPETVHKQPLRVAYHAACSLTHGQKISGKVESLLRKAGYEVLVPRDAHLCCGAAGSYTLLQPDMSQKLALLKAENLAALQPDIIATGNIGCQVQIAGATPIPTLHWVQLLDLALNGSEANVLN